jgi:hypothetical protein
MASCYFGGDRGDVVRRRVLALFVLMLITASRAGAVDGQSSSGTSGDGAVWANWSSTKGTKGTGPKQQKPPTDAELVATKWVNPCPTGEYGREIVAGYTPQDLGEKGIWAYRAHRCSPTDGWQTGFVCIERCPPGTPTYIEPQPPSWSVVRADLFQYAPDPQMQFAPPVETDPTIGAIVGKRLYVNLTEASFTPFEVTSYDTTGKFFARAYFQPVSFKFGSSEDNSDTCDGPGVSGRTAPGRQQLDADGCWILINTRPPTSHTTIRAVTTWRVTLSSNNPNVPLTDTTQTTNTFSVHIKELQAVIIR